MTIMRGNDYVSGKEATIQGIINGRVVDLFYVKNFEASVEFKKSEQSPLGSLFTVHKYSGASGTGSMTIAYVTSEFRALAMEYTKTRKYPYITMMVTNEDPASSAGKQTVAFYDCGFNAMILAKIDTEAEALDEDMDFTFSGCDMTESFSL